MNIARAARPTLLRAVVAAPSQSQAGGGLCKGERGRYGFALNRPRNRIDLSDPGPVPRQCLDPFAAVDIPDAGSAISCCGEQERAIFGIPHDMDGSWVFDLR